MIVETRHCDILGKRETKESPVRKSRILVQIFDPLPTPGYSGDKPETFDLCDDKHWNNVYQSPIKDMCAAAIDRAKAFAARGCTPTPKTRQATDGEAAGGDNIESGIAS